MSCNTEFSHKVLMIRETYLGEASKICGAFTFTRPFFDLNNLFGKKDRYFQNFGILDPNL